MNIMNRVIIYILAITFIGCNPCTFRDIRGPVKVRKVYTYLPDTILAKNITLIDTSKFTLQESYYYDRYGMINKKINHSKAGLNDTLLKTLHYKPFKYTITEYTNGINIPTGRFIIRKPLPNRLVSTAYDNQGKKQGVRRIRYNRHKDVLRQFTRTKIIYISIARKEITVYQKVKTIVRYEKDKMIATTLKTHRNAYGENVIDTNVTVRTIYTRDNFGNPILQYTSNSTNGINSLELFQYEYDE